MAASMGEDSEETLSLTVPTSSSTPTQILVEANSSARRDADIEETSQMQSLSLGDDGMERRFQVMLSRIANSDIPIKSQQRGDEELSITEKCEILRDFFDQKPVIFLERYNRVIQAEDLECFSHLSSVYEVSFYMNEIKKRADAKVSDVRRRNRRYEALKELESGGDYFSDEQMRSRDPLMFEHYVGQYLTDEERGRMKKEIDKTDLKFSTILAEFMDEADVKLLEERQKEEEEMVEEEEDSESEVGSDMEEEAEDFDEDTPSTSSGPPSTSPHQRTVPALPEAERELLRQEFRHHMQERFLKGKDEDFDYSKIDDNVEYDSLDIRGQDEEEKYFDDEEPREAMDPSESGSEEGCRTGVKTEGVKSEDGDSGYLDVIER